jgi:hypothetical protein
MTIIFFAGLVKISWNISKTGVDFMELLGNLGRPGTSREQGMNKGPKKKPDKKWNADGSKEI